MTIGEWMMSLGTIMAIIFGLAMVAVAFRRLSLDPSLPYQRIDYGLLVAILSSVGLIAFGLFVLEPN